MSFVNSNGHEISCTPYTEVIEGMLQALGGCGEKGNVVGMLDMGDMATHPHDVVCASDSLLPARSLSPTPRRALVYAGLRSWDEN